MRAVQVRHFGGPEVLEVTEIVQPTPGPGELLVDVAVAGVNFRDLLHRTGQFGAELPYVPGTEGSGRIVELGAGVAEFRPGERVAWKLGSSYAERVTVPASESVHVPEDIDDELAAASLLQGLTAHFLAATSYPVSDGAVALVHAAAGGVGSLLTQMVKRRGGRVIASVSTPEKGDVARSLGADDVLVYTGADFSEHVRELTDGQGVDVVYDGVGRTTFDASLASCRTRGSLVLYGASSGAVPPFEIMRLMQRGSITLSRPSVRDFTLTREEFDMRSAELFSWLTTGEIKVLIGGRYRLDEAGKAQNALETRRIVGKAVIRL